MKDILVGVDVGGTKTAFALAAIGSGPSGSLREILDLPGQPGGLAGELMPEIHREPTDKSQVEGSVIRQVAEGVARMVRDRGIDQDRLAGIGVGVPGLVDPDKGVAIFGPPQVTATTREASGLDGPISRRRGRFAAPGGGAVYARGEPGETSIRWNQRWRRDASSHARSVHPFRGVISPFPEE